MVIGTGVWRSCTTDAGATCVLIHGTTQMPEWPVGTWDTTGMQPMYLALKSCELGQEGSRHSNMYCATCSASYNSLTSDICQVNISECQVRFC